MKPVWFGISLLSWGLGAVPAFANWTCVAACAKAAGSWEYQYVTAQGANAADAFEALVRSCPNDAKGASLLVKSATVLRVGDDTNGWTLTAGWSPVTLHDACEKE
jgi:hypothetical protein